MLLPVPSNPLLIPKHREGKIATLLFATSYFDEQLVKKEMKTMFFIEPNHDACWSDPNTKGDVGSFGVAQHQPPEAESCDDGQIAFDKGPGRRLL